VKDYPGSVAPSAIQPVACLIATLSGIGLWIASAAGPAIAADASVPSRSAEMSAPARAADPPAPFRAADPPAPFRAADPSAPFRAADPSAAVQAADAARAIEVKVERRDPGIAVEARFSVEASAEEAWRVMTDYDHMPEFMTRLESSRVLERNGNSLLIEQKGHQTYGPFSFPFEYVRRVELTPFQDIRSKQVSGSLKQSDAHTRLVSKGSATEVRYEGYFVAPFGMVGLVGLDSIERETRGQFEAMRAEIERRKGQPR